MLTGNAAAKMRLLFVMRRVVDALQSGYLPIKKRDAREPGRRQKLETEKRLAEAFASYFRKQARAIRAQLEEQAPERKAIPVVDVPDEYDEALERDLLIILTDAGKAGIRMTSGIDYTRGDVRVVAWAREYVGQLIKGISETTRQTVQDVIALFAETPGFTIGDAVNMLPFGEERAWRIAVTETTRAYAQANILAGQQLKEEFPGVRVIKTWFTNNDDLVCDICAPLDGLQVDVDEDFAPGVTEPPAHVNCGCWISTRTKITED